MAAIDMENPAATNSTLETLARVPLFADLPAAERQDLHRLLQRRMIEPQRAVFWIGEEGDEFYIVESGSIAISYPDEGGKEVTLAVLGPGQFFGEVSLLDGGRRTATARAQERAELLALSREQFRQFVLAHPAAAFHMLAVLGRRQRETVEKLRGVRNVNEAVEAQETRGQKLVERVAAIGASGWFLLANLTFIAGWVAFHSLTYSAARERNPALPPIFFNDTPPTFFILCLFIALESIVLTMFVLNSQKRAGERAAIEADLDYQVNRKAQLEIMNLHQKLDRVLERLDTERG